MSKEYLNQYIESTVNNVLTTINIFDRLPNNPDMPQLEKNIRKQIEAEGVLTLTVIVCPSYNPTSLLSSNPEEYVCNKIRVPDLFSTRVTKINSLLNQLKDKNIKTKLTVLIGDTDPQNYVLPILESKYQIKINTRAYQGRIKEYCQCYSQLIQKQFPGISEVVSLSDLGSLEVPESAISQSQLEQETKFLTWLFSETGPYKNMFPLDPNDILQMVKAKFNLYGQQGWIISELTGGIILQTETPWLLRTQMLQSSGAPISAIYPWIRSEELSVI